jgi:hypothetical protein
MTNEDIRKLAQRAIRSAIRHHEEGRPEHCARALLYAQAILGEEETPDYAVSSTYRPRVETVGVS